MPFIDNVVRVIRRKEGAATDGGVALSDIMTDTAGPPVPRTVVEDDWRAMSLLGAAAFGEHSHTDSVSTWRHLVPSDGAVVVDDGVDIVAQSIYLDLRLTVPGGQVLPAAGISWVAVAPTHRRRGLLRSMYEELHHRIADAGYPLAALTASEGGIYGRFGYGPATIERELSIDRRFARFHAAVPDPGGVRVVDPAGHRDDFAAIYDRWRRRTPGGLLRPAPLWDELLADREESRQGASKWFAFLHPDGYALYRVQRDGPTTAHVSELRAVTTDAHVALWRALCGLDLIERIVVGSPPGDPLPHLFTDARLVRTTAAADDLWVRIMDVPAALEARAYQGDVSTVLQVDDGFRGAGGRFALDIRDGSARCAPTDAPAQVHTDLDVLGSLYLGTHRASTFAGANRLRCNDIELLRRFDSAFAGDAPAELGFGF